MPGIVITNGSVQADEQMYWYAAPGGLAKDGYLVMTFDPQGQGPRSDTFRPGARRTGGLPGAVRRSPVLRYGTEDAINFFLSNPKAALRPGAELRNGGRATRPKQKRTRPEGFSTPPTTRFWHETEGAPGSDFAGHSYGAAGRSPM